MVVLMRRVVAQKPADCVMKILNSCACYFPKSTFEDGKFSMHCTKHNNRGKTLFRVSGSVSECEKGTEITLNVHADLAWYFGCCIDILGVLWLICCLILSMNVLPCLAFILLGSLGVGTFYARGIELLDIIEHKITRKTDEKKGAEDS